MCRITDQTESEEKGGVSVLASAHLIRITFFSWKPSHSPPTLPLGPFNCLLVSVGGLLHSNTIALQGQSLYPLFFFLPPCSVQRMREGESQVAS